MTSRAGIGLILGGGLLLLVTDRAAEGAWILWEESNELHEFVRTPANHIRAVYPNVEDCIKAVDAEWDKVKTRWAAPDGGSERLGPTSAVIMLRYGTTTFIVTYTCLPDTVRAPPAPGK